MNMNIHIITLHYSIDDDDDDIIRPILIFCCYMFVELCIFSRFNAAEGRKFI